MALGLYAGPTLFHPHPTSYHVPCPPLALPLPPPPPTRIIHRRPPPRGCLKLNTDGSCVNGRGSFGGVFRDEFGAWFSRYIGRVRISNTTSVVAELWAVYQGLLVIDRLGIRNVIIETDCTSVIHLLTTSKVDGNPAQRELIDHGRLIMINYGCILVHTFREGNHCADQIAKLAGRQAAMFCFLDRVPTPALPYLLVDAQGIGFERPAKKHQYRYQLGVGFYVHGGNLDMMCIRYVRHLKVFGIAQRRCKLYQLRPLYMFEH